MPPKGYRKGHVKHPETGEWVDPRTINNSSHGVVLIKSDKKIDKKTTGKISGKKKKEDDLGPPTKSTKNTDNHPTIIITWKDSRGRSRTTQYTMADLSINEAISEIFSGAKKQARIHLSLDGNVLEKT